MARINQRLNGLNPLAYIGVEAPQPTDFITQPRDPTSNDSKNFNLGTWWLNTATQELFYLASLSGLVATWIQVSGASGTVLTLTGNSGGAVSPLVGDIQVIGDTTTINVVGNPGAHTLTISATGIMANSFPTDAGTATPALGILNVLGGTAGRDINTSGAGNTIHIDLNNAITLGDLSNIAPGTAALTLTTGDLVLARSNQAAATNQMIRFTTNSGADGNISMFLNNVFIGQQAGNTTMTAGQALFNVGIGTNALNDLTTGAQNTAIGGTSTLGACTTGNNNTGLGFQALRLLTTGSENTAVGDGALPSLLTGDDNIVIGAGSGGGYTGAESDNIIVGSALAGTTGESNTTRIGNVQTKTFIAGIRGITTAVNDAVAVLIDSAGQLGTTSSTIRVKENISDMGPYSDVLMKLRPVTFNYKTHSPESKSVGLIAEEVSDAAPHLVVYDNEGSPQTVKYHDLVPMLLNELQKLSARVKLLEGKRERKSS